MSERGCGAAGPVNGQRARFRAIGQRLLVVALLAGLALGVAPSRASGASPLHPAAVGSWDIHLPGDPVAMRVDEPAGRVIAATIHGLIYGGRDTVSFVSARTGRLLLSTPLPVTSCPACLGVDARRHRVVITSGNTIYTLDVLTGRILRTVHLAAGIYASTVAVAEAAGRAYVGDATGHALSVVDTATGALVRSVPLGRALPQAGAIDVIGVEADRRVVALTVSALVIVDGPSGRLLHVIHLTGLVKSGMLDARRHRAVVTAVGAYPDTFRAIADTLRGTLVRAAAAQGFPETVLALDTQSGRAAVFEAADREDLQTRTMHVVDIQTGREVASTAIVSPPDASAVTEANMAVATINPSTGHLLLVLENNPFVGTHTDCYLDVLDVRSGRVLRTLHLDGTTEYTGPTIVADRRAQRVYVATSDTGTVRVFDSTHL